MLSPLLPSPRCARIWLALLWLALPWALEARAEADREAALRAAFLYRLAFFVAWPEQRFDHDQQPIRLCVAGAVPRQLQQELRRAASQKPPQRGLEIVEPGQSAACELLYVGGDGRPPSVDSATLVVVDSAAALRDYGHLALLLEPGRDGQGRLIFRGDRARIRAAQYSLSSKLLSLVRFDD